MPRGGAVPPVTGDAADPTRVHSGHATGLRPGARSLTATARREGEGMNYPLLNVFWTIFEVFLWVIWFWILITVFIDIFRSADLSGWGKALWFLFVLLIPLIGVLVYLIARGGSMHERAAQQASRQEEAFRSYVQA